MKKKILCGLLILVLSMVLVSCGGDSPKIPSWLLGTWNCSNSGEKVVFSADNFAIYNAWGNEEVNISNMIAEVKNEGYKVGIKNSDKSSSYTLSIINKETNMMQQFVFEKISDNEFSFMGYSFTK